MNIITRFAEQEDALQLAQIYNHYIVHSTATFDLEPKTVEDRMSWIAAHPQSSPWKILVAEDPDGRICGFASTSRLREKAAYDTSAEVSIYIHPERVHSGLGPLLYTRLFSSLSRSGLHRLYACITIPNDPSVRLHERFGFRQVGMFSEAGFKHGAYRDVIWMERRLEQAL